MSKELAEVIVENGIVYLLGEHDLYYPDLGMSEGTHYNIGKYGIMLKNCFERIGICVNVCAG